MRPFDWIHSDTGAVGLVAVLDRSLSFAERGSGGRLGRATVSTFRLDPWRSGRPDLRPGGERRFRKGVPDRALGLAGLACPGRLDVSGGRCRRGFGRECERLVSPAAGFGSSTPSTRETCIWIRLNGWKADKKAAAERRRMNHKRAARRISPR